MQNTRAKFDVTISGKIVIS